MSDLEKSSPEARDTPAPALDQAGNLDLPNSWRYKSPKLGAKKIPWFASPEAQITLVALVCFMCPGMFNALSGLGGGGQVDPKPANDANTALYSTFAVVGFSAGSIVNRLGVRWSMAFSGIGYTVYVSSFLSYNYTKNYGYTVFAGFFLGCCAGVLWAAQGVIMMSYPPEQSKGRYIGWFWIIFNLGGVIGGLVPLGQNIHVKTNTTVTNGTYIGFMVLTFTGAVLALFLVNGNTVIRRDGSHVIMMKNPTWKSELLGLWQTLFTDPYIILLFPMFIASNWFYAYHFNDVNLAMFNTRTRSLNSVLYWSAQIVGAAIFGFLLDLKSFRRSVRAKAAWVALFVLTFAIWGGGYAFQRTYTRPEVNQGSDTPDDMSDDYEKMDWTSPGYGGPCVLYIVYGMYDAIWQVTVYWFMGAMTNNGRKLANFAGFYKGIQSAGGAITWRLDTLGTPFLNMFASCWGLLAGSLLVALPVLLIKIKDTVSVEDDLKFSDETVEEVVGREKSVEGEHWTQ